MELDERVGSGRVERVEGQVPLSVVVWLEQHPTAAVATAVSRAAPSLRWLFRLSETQVVLVRDARVSVLDRSTNALLGSVLVKGARSAADFDRLPTSPEPPPFSLPDVPFPVNARYACDEELHVARFLAPTAGASAPGLPSRLDRYAEEEPVERLFERLAKPHARAVWRPATLAVKVRELVSALSSHTVTGGGSFWVWYEDDRALLWPSQARELAESLVATLHKRGTCLGCARHDPRDLLTRGTWSYAPGRAGEGWVREEEPLEPLDVSSVARLVGRSAAELAATRLPLRFSASPKVDGGRVRLAD